MGELEPEFIQVEDSASVNAAGTTKVDGSRKSGQTGVAQSPKRLQYLYQPPDGSNHADRIDHGTIATIEQMSRGPSVKRGRNQSRHKQEAKDF